MARFTRKLGTRSPKKVIRIYTEGEKTEPNYFNSIKDELRLNEIDIIIRGMGSNGIPLVDYVIQQKRIEDEDTEWWVVFDKDDNNNFNQAIEKAENNGINAAYSNECFELWFVLHFEYLNNSIGRRALRSKLSKLLGIRYTKSADIYAIVKSKEATAIKNAKKLEKIYNDTDITSFTYRDPSTTVYKLVERLRELKHEE